jgi:hypothetical protein
MSVFNKELTTPQVVVFAVTALGIFVFGTVLTGVGQTIGGRGFPMSYIITHGAGELVRFEGLAFFVDVAFAVALSSLVFWVGRDP